MISCVMAVGFTLAAGVVTCALLHCCARCQKEAVMRATQSYCKARSSRITARNLSEVKLSYNFFTFKAESHSGTCLRTIIQQTVRTGRYLPSQSGKIAHVLGCCLIENLVPI